MFFKSVFETSWCRLLLAVRRVFDPWFPLPRGAWSPDRRPVRAIALYNGSDRPWGLNPNWADGGVKWLLKTMRASHAKGFRRFMWSLPAGRLNEGRVPWPSAQWQLLDTAGIAVSRSGSVRADLARCISPWLADNPDVQIIVYLGGVVKSAYDRDTHGAWVPDPGCPRDLRIIHLNFDGFAALSADRRPNQIGFWFDNSSPPEKRRKMYRLVQWLRAHSLWGGMEAVANDNLTPGDFSTNTPNRDYVRKVAMLGIRQFFDPTLRDDAGPGTPIIRDARATWSFDSRSSEVGFFLQGYPEGGRHGLTVAEGEAMLRDHHRRGFLLGTYAPRWEEIIMRIVEGG